MDPTRLGSSIAGMSIESKIDNHMALGKEKSVISEAAAGVMHEQWQEGFFASSPEGKRWKPIKISDPDAEKAYITGNQLGVDVLQTNAKGVKEIDIAHLPFAKLSPAWQKENLEAAQHAVGVVFDLTEKFGVRDLQAAITKLNKAFDGEDLDQKSGAVGNGFESFKGEPIMRAIHDAASEVHGAWLKRNDWVNDPQYGNPLQAKPYDELNAYNQKGDLNPLSVALDAVAGKKS